MDAKSPNVLLKLTINVPDPHKGFIYRTLREVGFEIFFGDLNWWKEPSEVADSTPKLRSLIDKINEVWQIDNKWIES